MGEVLVMYFRFLDGWIASVVLLALNFALGFRALQFLDRLCFGGRVVVDDDADADADESRRFNLGVLQSFIDALTFPLRLYNTTLGNGSDFGVFGKH